MPSQLSVGSNTWVTMAEAKTYLGDRLNSRAWEDASDREKTQSLLMAHRQIRSGKFRNLPGTASQAMKDAQCEQALFLLQQAGDQDMRSALQAQGVVAAGIVSEQYDAARAGQLAICAMAQQLLSDYFDPEGASFFAFDVDRDEDEGV